MPKALGDAAADLVYTPVVPCRIVDSRNVGGTFGGGETRGYHAFLTAWPFNVAQPGASTLNYAPGQVVANGAIIPLCQGVCTFDFSVVASGVDLIVDIVGYFKAPGGSLGTVTSVAAGAGLTGGPIIATGTIGIANGGVGSIQLAGNGGVTAKVADANITKAKLAATGGAAGQILGTDGTTLQWMAAPATLTPINPLGNSPTTVDGTGNVGWYTSITLGAAGLPVISYYDGINGDLQVAKCATACTGPVDRFCNLQLASPGYNDVRAAGQSGSRKHRG